MGDGIGAALRLTQPPAGGASQQGGSLARLGAGGMNPGIAAAGKCHAHAAVGALVPQGAVQSKSCPRCPLTAVIGGDMNDPRHKFSLTGSTHETDTPQPQNAELKRESAINTENLCARDVGFVNYWKENKSFDAMVR